MNPESRLRIPDYVLHQKVGEEMVLLQLDSGVYFGLDAVGTRLWELFSGGQTISEVIAALEGEYDVERSVLQSDVESLVEELSRQKLVFVE